MANGIKYTQDQVSKIFAERGYILLGVYRRRDVSVLVRCPVHNAEFMTLLCNFNRGSKLRCCGMEDRRATLKVSMLGSGNGFYGKKHSLLSRVQMSITTTANIGPPRGVAHPDYDHKKDADARRGIPRTKEVSGKLSAYMKKRHKSFIYCHRKAASGKTKGKAGIFYIVRIAGMLKLGSATTTMAYRLTRMKAKYPDASLVMYCLVPDAGDYEATMMMRCRQHWLHGEFFADFLAGS